MHLPSCWIVCQDGSLSIAGFSPSHQPQSQATVQTEEKSQAIARIWQATRLRLLPVCAHISAFGRRSAEPWVWWILSPSATSLANSRGCCLCPFTLFIQVQSVLSLSPFLTYLSRFNYSTSSKSPWLRVALLIDQRRLSIAWVRLKKASEEIEEITANFIDLQFSKLLIKLIWSFPSRRLFCLNVINAPFELGSCVSCSFLVLGQRSFEAHCRVEPPEGP